MGRGKPVLLRSIAFTTQTKALEFFGQMLNRYYPGEQVSDQDTVHLSSLLERHPEYLKKAAGGIDHFEVMTADEYRSKCFCIIRPDGASEDFSYRRCVTQRDE